MARDWLYTAAFGGAVTTAVYGLYALYDMQCRDPLSPHRVIDQSIQYLQQHTPVPHYFRHLKVGDLLGCENVHDAVVHGMTTSAGRRNRRPTISVHSVGDVRVGDMQFWLSRGDRSVLVGVQAAAQEDRQATIRRLWFKEASAQYPEQVIPRGEHRTQAPSARLSIWSRLFAAQ